MNEKLFLTAIGSGDAAFSVFTPENENVFSFIDKMQDLESEQLTLSYQVSGWYSNQNKNPLKIEKIKVKAILIKNQCDSFLYSSFLMYD